MHANPASYVKDQEDCQLMYQLLESGPVVVFEWSGDAGWPILYVTENVESILGIAYQPLKDSATAFAQYIHPEDLPRIEQEVSDYLSSQTVQFVQEYRLVNDAGHILWVKDYTVVQYDEAGSAETIKGYVLDISKEKEAEQKVLFYAFTDPLTQLPNRAKLTQDLQARQPWACALININRFREVNDLFGASVGDQVLKALGECAKTMPYSAYRVGGDELAILFYEESEHDHLLHQLEHILEKFENLKILAEGESIQLRFSVGVASGTKRLLTSADIALHQAKSSHHRIVFYDADEAIEEQYQKNLVIARELHEALLDDRVVCFYQPIYDIHSGAIDKFEALVRMIDSEGKVVPPMVFLPIARQMSLYEKITRRVIEQVCHDFADRCEKVSINLSIEDILNPDIYAFIEEKFANTEISQRIVFEVLETEGVEDYLQVEEFIGKVKTLGVQMAIDDFGSGYSNFKHISNLAFDYVKIDGSLIREVNENPKLQVVVHTVVDFAHRVGAKVIAEFVADDEICRCVNSLGVDQIQGYHIGQPVPIQEVDTIKQRFLALVESQA